MEAGEHMQQTSLRTTRKIPRFYPSGKKVHDEWMPRAEDHHSWVLIPFSHGRRSVRFLRIMQIHFRIDAQIGSLYGIFSSDATV